MAMNSNQGSILFLNAEVYCQDVPFASSVLVQDGIITWIGDASGAHVHRDLADSIIDCQGHFLAPAFVDAHVHASSTGLLLDGLDLTEVTTKHDLLDLLSKYAKVHKGGTVIGHGWDESQWTDPQLPTRREIDQATWGSVVYLSRVDVHSALVSNALVAQVPQSRSMNGFSDYAVSAQAHGALRSHALGHISVDQRQRAQRAFMDHALAHGIGSFHEMAGPTISSWEDAQALIDRSRQGIGPEAFVYWGRLSSEGGIEAASELGAIGAGGDLFIDGAIGSRTAALAREYSDAPENTGVLYMDADTVATHVYDCVQAGIQAGFHVIGDRGMQTVLEGMNSVAERIGPDVLSRGRHRLEHAELITDDQLKLILDFNLTSSMQPLFDSLWGGPHGMYQERLGERSLSMNRWASLLNNGSSVCFSSDCPVTDVNPWAAIHAAMFHHDHRERITARAAFIAHTRAGWRALGNRFDNRGVIAVGASADLALWATTHHMEVQVPDSRISQWSTDPRSATVPLPYLGDAHTFVEPHCQLTMVSGRVQYVSEDFDGVAHA